MKSTRISLKRYDGSRFFVHTLGYENTVPRENVLKYVPFAMQSDPGRVMRTKTGWLIASLFLFFHAQIRCGIIVFALGSD